MSKFGRLFIIYAVILYICLYGEAESLNGQSLHHFSIAPKNIVTVPEVFGSELSDKEHSELTGMWRETLSTHRDLDMSPEFKEVSQWLVAMQNESVFHMQCITSEGEFLAAVGLVLWEDSEHVYKIENFHLRMRKRGDLLLFFLSRPKAKGEFLMLMGKMPRDGEVREIRVFLPRTSRLLDTEEGGGNAYFKVKGDSMAKLRNASSMELLSCFQDEHSYLLGSSGNLVASIWHQIELSAVEQNPCSVVFKTSESSCC